MIEIASPHEIRLACRENRLDYYPSLAASGFLCLNLVMMDRDYADEFELFCRQNPRPCPLMAVVPAGDKTCSEFCNNLDLCTDLRSYDVYEYGKKVGSFPDVSNLFNDRMVSFLIGSSVSFDGLLEKKGFKASYGPCIYLTSLTCEPVGDFQGKMAVTMRSYESQVADQVAEFTAHFPNCHGGPLGKNNPQELGIEDESDQLLSSPGWVPEGHDKLYWACGVTSAIVAQQAKLPLMIMHTPGNALVTDISTNSLYKCM